MGTVLEVIVLVLILASFVLCYFSYRTWRIYQIVLVWFVFAAVVTFNYMAVRTLRTHQSWRSAALAWQQQVDKVEAKNRELLAGKEEQNRVVEQGIEQMKHELDELALNRGSVWFEVSPEKINGETGVCSLSIESPDPHQIAAKMVLFVFEQAKVEEGGRFLGEFKVNKAAAKSKTIEIAPNLPLTDEQLARLKRSKGPWTLYATMPTDNAEMFAALEDDERKALLPKGSLAEYAQGDRKLRDYEYFFHQEAIARELLEDALIKIASDIERTEAAHTKAEVDIKYRTTEKADLKGDLTKFQFERKAVEQYAQTLQKKLTTVRGELKSSLTATLRYATQIKLIQLKAAEAIDRATDEQADVALPAAASAP